VFYRMVTFSNALTDPHNPVYQVTAFLKSNILKTRDKVTIIGNHT